MVDEVRELSGKLGLDTTDFKTALQSANRELRVLESGFRASAAGLGDWAKNATGLELRIKSLTGQIDIQKSKVAALEGEYKRVAAEKGATSRAAQDLQIKLNKETETLGKMQVELGQDQRALDGMGKESESTAKETGDLARAEDRASGSTRTLGDRMRELGGKLQTASGNIRGIVVGVAKAAAGIGVGLVAAVGAAAVGIGALIVKTAAAADVIVESAEKIGISAEQYQELKYIGDQVGTSVEDIGRAFARTTKLIGEATSGNKDAAKAFRDLGVSLKDSNGNLRSTQDITFDLIAALGRMTDETQRDILAQKLFGKSFQELVPLVNLGADGAAEMTRQARAMGAVMSEKDVQAAAALNDKLGGLKAGLGGLAARLAGAFIPLVSRAADKMQEWLSNPAVQNGIATLQRALSLLTDAIGDLLGGNLDDAITKFGAFGAVLARLFGASDQDANRFGVKIINTLKGAAKGLSGIFAGIGKSIGPVKEFITNLAATVGAFITGQLIPFIQTHGPAIKGALAGIGIAIGTVAIVVPIVAAVIAALTSPITLIIAAAALLGAAWATNWGGIRDKTAAVWAWLQPILLAIGKWLGENIPKAVQKISEFITGTWIPAFQKVGNFMTTQVYPRLQELWNWLAINVPQAITTLRGFWDQLVATVTTVYNFFAVSLLPKFTELGILLGTTLGGIIGTFIDLLTGKIGLRQAFDQIHGLLDKYLNPILTTLGGIFDTVLPGPIKTFIRDILDKLATAFNNIQTIINGIIKTIEDFIAKLIEAASRIPKIFQPGSPTPFERGLRGIGKALDELAKKQLPEFQARLLLQPEGIAATGAAGQPVQIIIQATVKDPIDYYKLGRIVGEEYQRRQRR